MADRSLEKQTKMGEGTGCVEHDTLAHGKGVAEAENAAGTVLRPVEMQKSDSPLKS